MILWREEREASEAAHLASYAMCSRHSRGREHPEEEHPYRTAFQRDRDRILHTTAFRRLEYKTQVFVVYEGDYYRTRLTHTLEVAQIGRTIARALRANEDLVEAISLAHDLGHTPFGHAGEGTLHELMTSHGGFDHNQQSLRIVEVLEHRYDIYQNVWSQARELRISGEFLEIGKKIQCPVVAIHGDYDPHLSEGVKDPLSRIVKDFRFILLENCGHQPWIERAARDRFYSILKSEVE